MGTTSESGADEQRRAAILDEAQRQYSTGWPEAFEIDPQTTALVVVDMQVAFVDPHSDLWVPEATRIAPRIVELIGIFESIGRPVVFTQATYPQAMPNDMPRYCRPIADGQLDAAHPYNAMWPGFHLGEHHVVSSKRSYDAFAGTELDTVLGDGGVDTVVIAGTMTNFCCEGTARTAFSLGYHVVVGSDICASDLQEAHDASLRTLRRGFARVMTADEITAELQGR